MACFICQSSRRRCGPATRPTRKAGLDQRCLKAGERVSSDYFDVRFFPLSGTIHFFGRSKELIDRLNRTVGKRRQWLPPQVDQEQDKAFWKAYNAAEKLDNEVRAELAKQRRAQGSYSRFDDPVEDILYGRDNAERSSAELSNAISSVLRTHNLLDALEQEELVRTQMVETQGEQLLLA
ncbi:MAG: DUF4942 domain-containing protein [Nevskiaceae bacterium]|nr:MAG: DUF4942 domain-containing protein [Nevskiaceae bacterium]